MIAWEVFIQGVKDPAALMEDFEFASAKTVDVMRDDIFIIVLEHNDDGKCAIRVSVRSHDGQSVCSILEERALFAENFMKGVQTHAGVRGVDLGDTFQITGVGQASVTGGNFMD